MKKFTFIFFSFFANFCYAQVNPNHVYVSPHIRSNGSYVPGHYRTAPNNTNRDNFSTQGNINPYTLQPGWVTPDSRPLPNSYNSLPLPQVPVGINLDDIPLIETPRSQSYLDNQAESVELQRIRDYCNTHDGITHILIEGCDYHDRKYTADEKIIIERLLKQQGYYVGVADSQFTWLTIESIMRFQRDNNLFVDGKLGPASLNALTK